MIRQLALLLTVYVAFVLEASGVAAADSHVEPRWILLAAAWALWTQRLSLAVLWGGLCGLLGDVLSGGQLGVGVAVVATGVSAIGWLRRDRRWTSGMAFLFTTFLLTALCSAALTFLHQRLVGASPLAADRLALAAAGQGVLTAVWGGGLWCVDRFVSAAGRRLVPPLDWRQASS